MNVTLKSTLLALISFVVFVFFQNCSDVNFSRLDETVVSGSVCLGTSPKLVVEPALDVYPRNTNVRFILETEVKEAANDLQSEEKQVIEWSVNSQKLPTSINEKNQITVNTGNEFSRTYTVEVEHSEKADCAPTKSQFHLKVEDQTNFCDQFDIGQINGANSLKINTNGSYSISLGDCTGVLPTWSSAPVIGDALNADLPINQINHQLTSTVQRPNEVSIRYLYAGKYRLSAKVTDANSGLEVPAKTKDIIVGASCEYNASTIHFGNPAVNYYKIKADECGKCIGVQVSCNNQGQTILSPIDGQTINMPDTSYTFTDLNQCKATNVCTSCPATYSLGSDGKSCVKWFVAQTGCSATACGTSGTLPTKCISPSGDVDASLCSNLTVPANSCKARDCIDCSLSLSGDGTLVSATHNGFVDLQHRTSIGRTCSHSCEVSRLTCRDGQFYNSSNAVISTNNTSNYYSSQNACKATCTSCRYKVNVSGTVNTVAVGVGTSAITRYIPASTCGSCQSSSFTCTQQIADQQGATGGLESIFSFFNGALSYADENVCKASNPCPSCTGEVPVNADLCTGDEVTSANLSRIPVNTCTSRACEYKCRSGYTAVNGVCRKNLSLTLNSNVNAVPVSSGSDSGIIRFTIASSHTAAEMQSANWSWTMSNHSTQVYCSFKNSTSASRKDYIDVACRMDSGFSLETATIVMNTTVSVVTTDGQTASASKAVNLVYCGASYAYNAQTQQCDNLDSGDPGGGGPDLVCTPSTYKEVRFNCANGGNDTSFVLRPVCSYHPSTGLRCGPEIHMTPYQVSAGTCDFRGGVVGSGYTTTGRACCSSLQYGNVGCADY